MNSQVEIVFGFADYPLSVRVWRPATNTIAQIVILHGIVSHSEWLAPIAERIATHGIEVICPDRRGTGLNKEQRGDAPDLDSLILDIDSIQSHFQRPGATCHLAGFCWGGTYAISHVNKNPAAFQSLILIAPSVFVVQDVADQELVTGVSSIATEPPLVPLDRFTSGPDH